MSHQQFDEVDPLLLINLFVSSLDGTLYTVGSALTVRTRLDQIWFANFDSIAHLCEFLLVQGSDTVSAAQVTVPASTGVGDAAKFVEVLSTVFPSGQQGLVLPAGVTLKIRFYTAIVDAGLSFWALGGTF